MSITTKAELATALDRWLARTDLQDFYDDFIVLFEAHANRRLRVRDMETDAQLTPSSGSVTLPDDYLAWRRVLALTEPRTELEYVQPSYLHGTYPSTDEGWPRVFTISGGFMRIRPVTTESINLSYYQKITAITSSATNWLFDAHPDAYLFGALTEAYLFDKDEERAGIWRDRRDGVLAEIERLSNKSRGPGTIRTMTPTP